MIGSIIYGGQMNSETVGGYKDQTGISIKKNYEYFHFNDLFSSYLTLFVFMNGHNWMYVTEHMYYVKDTWYTTLFFGSFNILVAYTCCALILGLISRLLILYFEKDFEKI